MYRTTIDPKAAINDQTLAPYFTGPALNHGFALCNTWHKPLFIRLQATGFVLQPDGTIAVSVYSSGAIGRLVAADTINFIKYMQHQMH